MCVVGLFIFIFIFILGEGELVVSMEREMPTLELLVDWLCVLEFYAKLGNSRILQLKNLKKMFAILFHLT